MTSIHNKHVTDWSDSHWFTSLLWMQSLQSKLYLTGNIFIQPGIDLKLPLFHIPLQGIESSRTLMNFHQKFSWVIQSWKFSQKISEKTWKNVLPSYICVGLPLMINLMIRSSGCMDVDETRASLSLTSMFYIHLHLQLHLLFFQLNVFEAWTLTNFVILIWIVSFPCIKTYSTYHNK